MIRASLAFLFLSAVVVRAVDDVSAELAPLIEGKPIPGLVAAAVVRGQIVASGATGVRKAGEPEKVTVEDRFHLGSCTKSMTATLAAMLVKDGKIHWDDTAAKLFPEIEVQADFRTATLRQLLSNTGGAPHDVPPPLWGSLWNAKGPEVKQRLILVRGILGAAPEAPPGTRGIYSNAGFSIGGAMLERATGRAYDDLLTERLFKPLGMKSAGFGTPAQPGRILQPYGHHVRDGQAVPDPPAPGGDNPPAITPAGRVHASILDFAKYAAFHAGDAPKGPLDAGQLAFLHTAVEPSTDYAMGWALAKRDWAGGTALTHTGSNTAFFAVMWIAPEKHFAAVAACNCGEGAEVCDAAVAMLIQRCLKEK